MTIPKAAVSEVGLDFSQIPDQGYDAWAALGPGIAALGRLTQWAIGDWIEAGNTRYGEKYSQAVNDLGKDYNQLANMAWVCRRVPLPCRRAGLSWSVHRIAAGFVDEKIAPSLDVAETGGLEGAPMTVAEFTRYAKDAGLLVPKKREKKEEPAQDAPELTWTDDGLWGYVRVDAKALRALYDACIKAGEGFSSIMEEAVERLAVALETQAAEAEAGPEAWEHPRAEGAEALHSEGEEVPEAYEYASDDVLEEVPA